MCHNSNVITERYFQIASAHFVALKSMQKEWRNLDPYHKKILYICSLDILGEVSIFCVNSFGIYYLLR